MRFLADMGVSQQVVVWLHTKGHEAVHLRDEGLQRLPNGEIFHKAACETSGWPLRIMWQGLGCVRRNLHVQF